MFMKIFHINISGINHREEVASILFRSKEKFRALRSCCLATAVPNHFGDPYATAISILLRFGP